VGALLKNVSGVIVTGGGADFTDPDGSLTQCALAAQLVFNKSVASWAVGKAWPLWGTCLGHELISFLAAHCNSSTLMAGYQSANVSWSRRLRRRPRCACGAG